ncbi:NAD(P)H-dependent oxidoreductase [uncultured Streptococcus sp.]|uniref:NAD(P)H-dependent oxidoreductase n=1 Tax=uncultured Streptococcus sp. TaxID=83427 RepID=UPI0028DD3967|nr:NAD(P)H-dependent oxidoreductase [uncultured Streptococcus sp.]
MNSLIIYAHPDKKSFNASILKTVQENLSHQHDVKTLDLYEEEFDPVLRFDAIHRRRDLANDVAMKHYRDLLVWADQLIFIFPTWWSGMPAILKGFIERVFVAGFAYDNTPRGLKGRLAGQAWIITTHNTPKIFLPFAQDYSKVLKFQILKPCGFKTVKVTQVTRVEYMSNHERKEQLEKIAKIAKSL